MQQARLSTIAHRGHVYCNPVNEQALDELVGIADLPRGARVLDVGCGKGELLVRLAERHGARGIGIDRNEEFLSDARQSARQRVPDAALELVAADAGEWEADTTFDLAACIGSTHALGGFAPALRRLREWTRHGGWVLAGEGFWRRPPDPEYLAAIDATEGELAAHDANLAMARDCGLTPVAERVASDDDWNRYEALWAGNVERWAVANPEDPEREGALERVRAWRAAYLRWGHRTMGFALYLLRRD